MNAWGKTLTGLYVIAAEHALQYLTGRAKSSLMRRLMSEAADPCPPLPALSSVCRALARNKRLDRRMKAYFEAVRHVGPDLRNHGTQRAMLGYLTRFRNGL